MHKLNEIEIQVSGIDFVCLNQGRGPLVLLVHGFPDIPQTWVSQMQALADAGYQVVAPYLPGYLPSRVTANTYFDKASLVNGIAGLIEALSLQQKTALRGARLGRHHWLCPVCVASRTATQCCIDGGAASASGCNAFVSTQTHSTIFPLVVLSASAIA